AKRCSENSELCRDEREQTAGVGKRFFDSINAEARPVDDTARRLLAQPSALCKAYAEAERR
ncbi:MAG: hypothetical protein IJE28_05250, partial [Oscillospiraceae bacterium]|nr:hypothetical protein [Oscillospiraceae bacterium]